MKVKFLTSILFILFFHFSYSQSWQWGKTGGGTADMLVETQDQILSMATDNNGNVYALTKLANSNYNVVDGTLITLPSLTDATMVFSYKCDGTFRWAKLMQFRNGSVLDTDTLGGVYIAGNIGSNEFFVGNLNNYNSDTSFTMFSSNLKTIGLVKLDTLGNTQWIKIPQPDTVSFSSEQSFSIDLDVENNGTIHWMCSLTPGNYDGNNLIVNARGYNAIRFNKSGVFIGNTSLNITTAYNYSVNGYPKFINYSKGNDKYIISGCNYFGDPMLTIGSTIINNSIYIASINKIGGGVNWIRQSNTPIFSMIRRKPVLDNENNIYLSGELSEGYSFNGFTQENIYTDLLYVGTFIQKMDENGIAIWTHGASCETGESLATGGVSLSGSEVAILGSYSGLFKWDNASDSLLTDLSYFANVFLTRFNRFSGDYIQTDTLFGSNSAEELPTSITNDKNNNYYVGGRFEWDILLNGVLTNSAGGAFDFFIAKFGTENCSSNATNKINENNLLESISIFPNPTNQGVFVDLENSVQKINLTILNSMGQKLMEKNYYQKGQFYIDLSNYENGIYFIEIQNENSKFLKKIIKQFD